MLGPDALVELLEHLATPEDARAFRKLADALYAPLPPSAAEEVSPLPIRRVAAGLDDYWYAATLPRAWVVLKNRLGLVAFRTLVRWLREWQRMAGYADEEDHDTSHIWCQSVTATSAGLSATPIGHALVGLLATEAVESWRGGTSLGELDELLKRGKQPIFLRVWMHVLTVAITEGNNEEATEAAQALLLSDDAFDLTARHEFAALARVVLARADATYVGQWTGVLDTYPTIDDATLRERLTSWQRSDEPVSDEDLTKTRRGVRRSVLTAIGDPLPPLLDAMLAGLDEEFGEHGPEPDDVPFHISSGFTGPISPVPFEELAALAPTEVLAFVREWEPEAPSGWPPPPTPEGLGRALSRLVHADPAGFVAVLDSGTELDATYLRGILDGFETALREGTAFPWPAVLELVGFVAAQPDEGEDPAAHVMERDVGWRWSHAQAARLLATGLDRNPPLGIPIEERARVFAALALLAESPNPTPEEDAANEGSMGPLDRSLNVVRGQALRAVLAYLAWVWRLRGGEVAEGELDEVAALLDRHLDTEHDPSTAIRSVYGEHFWHLLEALPAWTTRNVARIVSEGEAPQTELGDAAWSSYLAAHNPNRHLLELLGAQYRRRIERLAGTSPEDTSRFRDIESGASRLAEHGLLLYTQGTIALDSDDGLLRALFATAPATVLGEALGYLFWRILRTEGALDNTFLQRIMDLWDWRVVEIAAGRGDPGELRGFAWLVRTGRFPIEWMLTNLAHVASTLGSLEMPDQIAEAIAPYSRSHTRLVLAVFHGLMNHEHGGGAGYQLAKHAVSAIACALRGSDEELQHEGRALMNAFAEAGIADIRAQIDGVDLPE